MRLPTRTRRLFLAGWAAGLALLHMAWSRYGDLLQARGEEGALWALSAMMVALPWAVGPGLLQVLRRMPSGGVNLPHAEYWFAGERRPASLDRLEPYLDVMALLLTVFLVAVLVLFVTERTEPVVMMYSGLMFLGLVIAMLGGTVLWTRAVMRAFPAPDPSTRGRLAVRSRRPIRPRR